jgi:hypothetical protein
LLATTLFFLTLVGLAAGVIVEGAFGFARVSARHAASHYAQIGLMQARTQLLQSVASQIAAGEPLDAPPPLPPSPVCSDSVATCSFILSASFALQGTLADAGSNVVATDVQPLASIAESRLAATIVETVSSSSGVVITSRTEYVTLRTFAVPPYVAIDGITDAEAARDVPFEPDAAGCDPTNPALCDLNNTSLGSTPAPVASMNPGDTRIHALSECIDNGSGACAGQQYISADPPDIPQQSSWFNGNAQSDGWSR